ncbi:MAG: hypothetical protein ACPHYG_05060, partial [Flavobacteriales bacterium]
MYTNSGGKPNPDVDVFSAVQTRMETEVLCVPEVRGDNSIYTWNSLKAPPEGSEERAKWDFWLQPGNWTAFIRGMYDGSLALKPFGSGAYNTLLEPTAATPVNDFTSWPPQFKMLGVDKFSIPDDRIMLPDRPYLIRTPVPDTRDPQTKQARVSQGATTHREALEEVANSLRMASLGIGPAIYAAIIFPWSDISSMARSDRPRWGLMMVQDKADYDLKGYISTIKDQYPPKGPNQVYDPRFHACAFDAASQLTHVCHLLSLDGYIHYDIKLAQIISYRESNVFRMIDFDSHFFHKFGTDVAGPKACFFVTLLLLCMHVRAGAPNEFAIAFMSVAGRSLMELWTEVVTTPSEFGAGADWLRNVTIATTYETGKFVARDVDELPTKQLKALTILRNMTWEYFQNPNANPPLKDKILKWKGWRLVSGSDAPAG